MNGQKKQNKPLKTSKLSISPPVVRALTPEGLFQLESDTLCECVEGTSFQKQGDEWVVIGYHSKRLPISAKNFGVTKLELTGLLVNIHGFIQLLHNQQGDEWVVIGYHSKRLPTSAKNFGVIKIELTGLLVNIHRFMQLLCNQYFEVLVDHKAIEYMVKSRTETPTTRLKTLLLKHHRFKIPERF